MAEPHGVLIHHYYPDPQTGKSHLDKNGQPLSGFYWQLHDENDVAIGSLHGPYNSREGAEDAGLEALRSHIDPDLEIEANRTAVRVKHSDPRIEFVVLYRKLLDWIDDEPKHIQAEANKDEVFCKLCNDLYRLSFEIDPRDLKRGHFVGPSDQDFVKHWRDFELRARAELAVVALRDLEATYIAIGAADELLRADSGHV
jgi:hypothetical protein